MEFRWIALIALWTLLAGPVFHAGNPGRASRPPDATAVAKSTKP